MYSLVVIPTFARKNFFDFSKLESKEYLQWFLNIKKARLMFLESFVKETYPMWRLDFTKQSLNKLYSWFREQVQYRPMTEFEKKAEEKQIQQTPLFEGIIPIAESTFDDETVSICFDVGLYFGETLINNIPELVWTNKLSSKSYVYYGQPILSKPKSKVPLNPRASIEGIARRILDKDVHEVTFESLYDIWFEKFIK